MSLISWLQNLRSTPAKKHFQHRHLKRISRPGTKRRLNVEVLEGRRVLAYAVTSLWISEAVDLNEAGQIVGNDGGRAFLLDNGNSVDLGTLGGTSSYANGINDLGQVVGLSTLGGDAVQHAFLITPQDGDWYRDSDLDGRNDLMFDLGTLPGADSFAAQDINNAGQVVGNSGDHAFLWDAVHDLIDLGDGYATAINGVGQVTGTTGTRGLPFLWDAVNGMTVLDPGPGYYNASAGGINDAGQIAGSIWAENEWGSWTEYGFQWDGGYLYMGGISSSAADINNLGQIAGSITEDSGISEYDTNAVLWNFGGGTRRLGPYGDVTLESAQAVNDRGDILARGYDAVLDSYNTYFLTPIAPSPPSISIGDAPEVTEGNTGTRLTTFTVTLSAASADTVAVAYNTVDGTATAGSDYQVASGTLTFAPGETSKVITVWVDGDRLPEPNETFSVNLSSPTNATIAKGQGVGSIFDDEPRVSISDVSKFEGKKGSTTLFTFTVTLSVAYDQSVTMSFKTVNGTAKTSDGDYVGKTGTLTFAPGETIKTIAIEVQGDGKKESDEIFYLDLFGLSSNALFTKNRGVGKILNDD